jgi:hypothetical protein
MGELFLPVGIMVFTVIVSLGCVAAARDIMAKREKLIEGWLRKSGGRS